MLLSLVLSGLQLILVAYIILSWLEFYRQSQRRGPLIDPGNPVVRFIEQVAFTILHPIRRVLAPYQRGVPIDFSVIVAILLIALIRRLVVPNIPF
jgi:uncharacterized protein YggT (Ycf19 family)